MPDLSADTRAVVDAIQDLTRLTVALHGSFASKSETIRKLSELSIPASRIAGILAMSVSDVQSALNKAKKRAAADGALEAKVGRAASSSATTEAADAPRV